MPISSARLLLLAPSLAVAACGQTGLLVLPEHSPPKQGYLLVDKPPPGTVITPVPARLPVKPTPVPTPTTPFPPQVQPSRSPLSNNSTTP